MIVNVGGRTDIVNYFSDWLMNRINEGFVYSRNPLFPKNVSKVSLNPKGVDCLMFCSKNYKPMLRYMDEINNKYRIICHYTITAYDKDVEPNVPSVDESIKVLIELSNVVGKEKVLWRYDPILLTEKYTVDKHLQTFEYMAKQIAPYVQRCIFSFVEMYKKLEYNMPELIPLSQQDIEILAQGLGSIAQKYGILIQTCGTNGDFSHYGIQKSGCMTLDIIGKANNILFKDLKHKGSRQGCHCIASRDIGAYDTCMNGCKYCYANKNTKKAFENFKYHNVKSPLLLGEVKPSDTIIQGSQKSFQKNKTLI